MVYDFEFQRPSYYSRPRYYSSYSPYSHSSYLHDRYYYPYRYYQTPWYRSPSAYSNARTYVPYRPIYDYRYNIPDYRYYTNLPSSKIFPPIYPEAEKYEYTYGLNFDSTAKDIRSATFRLLQDVRQTVRRAGSLSHFERETSVPRFTRASRLEPQSFDRFIDTDDDYYRAKRSISRQRMMSEGPSSSYRNYLY